jgi:hypothetical protein
MWTLKQTTRSLIDGVRRRCVARRQRPDQQSHLDGKAERDEASGKGLELEFEYGDRFIFRMIQLSQMPRTRSPRDRTTFSMRPVSASPAYGL